MNPDTAPTVKPVPGMDHQEEEKPPVDQGPKFAPKEHTLDTSGGDSGRGVIDLKNKPHGEKSHPPSHDHEAHSSEEKPSKPHLTKEQRMKLLKEKEERMKQEAEKHIKEISGDLDQQEKQQVKEASDKPLPSPEWLKNKKAKEEQKVE